MPTLARCVPQQHPRMRGAAHPPMQAVRAGEEAGGRGAAPNLKPNPSRDISSLLTKMMPTAEEMLAAHTPPSASSLGDSPVIPPRPLAVPRALAPPYFSTSQDRSRRRCTVVRKGRSRMAWKEIQVREFNPGPQRQRSVATLSG